MDPLSFKGLCSSELKLLTCIAYCYVAHLNFKEESLEYQQADTLWELFCECKVRLVSDETSYLDDDGEDSRLSSATDDISRSTLPVGDAISECLKVPVLKLKVGSSGGYVDSASLSQVDCANSSVITPSNDCSSDFDGASENQSMSTTQGRLSSCSEIDDQLMTEVRACNFIVFRLLCIALVFNYQCLSEVHFQFVSVH